MIWFKDVDRFVAEEHARAIIGQHAARLWDLAHLMAGDGGPVDSMDASLESLIPLWAWYRRFLDAGMPGVSLDARPARGRIVEFGGDRTDIDWRVPSTEEMVTSYGFEVVRRAYPHARWALLDDAIDGDHQATGIDLGAPGWRFVSATSVGSGAGSSYLHGWEDMLRNDRLQEIVELNYFSGSVAAPSPTGVSILTPLLGIPRPDDSPATGPVPIYTPALTRRVSKARAAKEAEANRTRGDLTFGGEYVLAAPGAYIDDLENSTPLPTRDIIRILNDHGYTTDDGRRITTRTLTDEHTDLTMPDTASVDISVLTHRGKLRALFADVTGPDGTGILTHLHDTAPHHGARLRPTDQLPSRR